MHRSKYRYNGTSHPSQRNVVLFSRWWSIKLPSSTLLVTLRQLLKNQLPNSPHIGGTLWNLTWRNTAELCPVQTDTLSITTWNWQVRQPVKKQAVSSVIRTRRRHGVSKAYLHRAINSFELGWGMSMSAFGHRIILVHQCPNRLYCQMLICDNEWILEALTAFLAVAAAIVAAIEAASAADAADATFCAAAGDTIVTVVIVVLFFIVCY